MKTLVVYYSLEGNTRLIANTIAEATGADVLELKPVDPVPARGLWKFLKGGKQVLTKATPALEPLQYDPEAYDILFIGTPVWASSYAPALKTFFEQVDLSGKQIALFCCYAGSEGKTFKAMSEALTGNTIIGSASFRDPRKRDTEAQTERADAWVRSLPPAAA